ncbi:MAG: S8 family serine peptidase [Flavobacteriales bacterium]|nr:S8 family serine peptidase [Flavobacteriales bacterium]
MKSIRAMSRLIMVVLFCLGATMPLFSQSDYRLLFDAETFTPPVSANFSKGRLNEASSNLIAGKTVKIVQFYTLPTDVQLQTLRAKGVDVINYIPNMAYYMAIPQGFEWSSLDNVSVRAVLDVAPHLKIHKDITLGSVPPHAERPDGRAALQLGYFANLSYDIVATYLTSKGVRIIDADKAASLIEIEADISRIYEIASWPCTAYLESVPAPPVLENMTGTTLHRVNGLQQLWSGGRYYDGSGVTVNVGDGGYMDAQHIDFEGRLTGASSSGETHGTHVGGIIGSAGNLDPEGRGQAPGVDIRSSSGHGDVSSNLSSLYNTYGVRVTNHSLGQTCGAGYDGSARTADLAVNSYAAIYHVFSAGNSGTSDCGLGAGSGWGNITGGYKAAKNTIAVGNLSRTDGIASSSSRGPTPDGRIKPDICAKGSSVFSTYPDNTYSTISGTSMASPGVAGCTAALISAFRSLNSNQDPKLGLLKGVMLNTADDLGNPGPDYIYGWGRINALRAVRVLENNQYASGTVSTGQSPTHQITVPSGVGQVKVMVYWKDPAAASGVSVALINDIDMTLKTPGGTSYDPWTLSTNTNSASALDADATRGKDRRNNMEQVTLDNPAAGTYTVTVNGYQIPSGPQEYFVSWTFLEDNIEVTYPNGNDPLVPGETVYLRWDAWGTSGNFTLEYSTNGGTSWSNISTSVSGSQRYYAWTVPSTVTGKMRIRVSRSGKSDTSDQDVYNIAVPSNLRINKRCSSAFVLEWNAVSGATGYEVFLLGNKYMESQGTTTNTEFTITSPSTVGNWVSVRALGPDNCKGRRAVAIEKVTGTNSTDCINTQPPIADFISSSTCGATVYFTDQSENEVTSWLWDFGDGNSSTTQNPSHTYATDGTYTVSLTVSGTYGTDSIVKNNDVTVIIPEVTSVTGDDACGASALTLTASGKGNLKWYDAASGGNLLTTGTSYTTPVLSATADYYVVSSVALDPVNFGPPDNNLVTGGYYTSGSAQGIFFDVSSPFTLASVKVFAGSAGNRTIEVLDADGGNVIHTIDVNVPAGESRVTLNFDMEVGMGYFMKISSTLVDLYRNNQDPGYPFTLNGVVEITASNASTPTGYYYYFYDWEVIQTCSSQPTTVTGTIHTNPAQPVITLAGGDLTTIPGYTSYQWYLNGNPIGGATNDTYTPVQNGDYTVEVTDANGCTSVSDPFVITAVDQLSAEQQRLNIYPNPANGAFHVALRGFNGPVQVEVYNVLGEMMYRHPQLISGDMTLGLSLDLPPGIYHLKVSGEDGYFVRPVMME